VLTALATALTNGVKRRCFFAKVERADHIFCVLPGAPFADVVQW
jgi:hypothetical protein